MTEDPILREAQRLVARWRKSRRLGAADYNAAGLWPLPLTPEPATPAALRGGALDYAAPGESATVRDPAPPPVPAAVPQGLPHWETPIPAGAGGPGWTWTRHDAGHHINPVYRVSGPGGALLLGKTPRRYGTTEPAHAEVGNEVAINAIHRALAIPNIPHLVRGHRPGPGGALEPAVLARLVHPFPGSKRVLSLFDAVRSHLAPSQVNPNFHGPANGVLRAMLHNPSYRRQLVHLLMANHLVNALDRHGTNYLLGPRGEVVPIDFGNSFFPHPHNDAIPAKPDFLRNSVDASLQKEPLDRDLLDRALRSRGLVDKMVAEHVLPHYGAPEDRRQQVLDVLDRNFDLWGRLQKMKSPRVSHLPLADPETVEHLRRVQGR